MHRNADFSRMNVLVILLAVLVLLIMVSPQFTGWFSNILRMDIGVAEENFMCLYFVEHPANAIQDSVQNITVDATNCGSRHLDGKLVVEIRNSDMDVVDTINSSNYSLSPSQYFLFSTEWSASVPLGRYWIFVKDENENVGTTNTINETFNVTCEVGTRRCFGNSVYVCTDPMIWDFVESCSNGCEGGFCKPAPGQPSGGAPSGGGIITQVSEISLDYMKSIETAQGNDYTFLIKATNNGSTTLHNLTIDVKASGVSVKAEDIEVKELSPGGSIFFVLNVSVPKDAGLGNYSVSFVVRADETSVNGGFVVSVTKKAAEYTMQEQCDDIINYYIDVTGKLNRELIVLEARGNNVTEVRKLLQDAVREIEIAKQYRDMEIFESCVKQKDVIRRKIERVADAIAIISTRRPAPEQQVAQPVINLYILYVIIAVIVLVVMIVGIIKAIKRYLRKRRLMMIEGRW